MNKCLPTGAVHVKDVYLWAHVGVFEHERLLGQAFTLDFSIWLDLDKAAEQDDLSFTADYSLAITELQHLAFQLSCLTIEHFGYQILNKLEALYGPAQMRIKLTKCSAPIRGFSGSVAVEMQRYISSAINLIDI